ncbi:hypothetical protein NIES2107_58900 [Nostoc carneum NIES-2107]|nr:hypothetical protein NIES2107_58900 [Nostoc carneum NIES-2107]
MPNTDQSVNSNISVDACGSTPVHIKPTEEFPPNSIASLMIATAILLRALTGLIQVLVSTKQQKGSKDKAKSQ